jgi:tetratricopeptide (TPR) repeat protein
LKWNQTVQNTFYHTNNYRQPWHWHYKLTAYWNELRFTCRLWFDPSKKSNYDQIKKLASSLADPLMGYGKALEQLGEEDKKQPQYKCNAEEAYKRAIALSQKDDRAYSNLASLLIEQGNYNDAENYLNYAINRNTQTSFYAYNVRGNLYHDLGDYQKAIANYLQAIAINPSYISAYRNLGITYADDKNFEKSIESFDEAMEHLRNDELFCGNNYANKWHAWLHNGRGWTYLLQSKSDLKKLDDAERNFKEAIELCAHLYTPVFNLGLVYFLKGKKEEAIQEWQKGIELLTDRDREKNQVQTICNYSNIWHQLLAALYSFAQEPSQNQNVKQIQEIFDKNKDKSIPIRIKKGILKDAEVIKRGLKQSSELENIQIIISTVKNYLPSNLLSE